MSSTKFGKLRPLLVQMFYSALIPSPPGTQWCQSHTFQYRPSVAEAVFIFFPKLSVLQTARLSVWVQVPGLPLSSPCSYWAHPVHFISDIFSSKFPLRSLSLLRTSFFLIICTFTPWNIVTVAAFKVTDDAPNLGFLFFPHESGSHFPGCFLCVFIFFAVAVEGVVYQII